MATLKSTAQNATLDAIGMGALASGIGLITASKLNEGIALVLAGVLVLGLKYHFRR